MAGSLITALSVAASLAYAQSADSDKPMTFDVASVKQVPLKSTGGAIREIRTDPGMLSGNASLKQLVREAYSVPDVLISGGPPWLDSAIYAISARTEAHATPDQLRLMLRALLAERFNLKVHRETREMAFYALIQGKNGAKTEPIDPGDNRPFGTHGGVLHVPDLAGLARRMSAVAGRPVIDQTGIDGVDVTISLEAPRHEEFVGDPRIDAAAIRDAYFASLVRGAEKLGLKLEARKGPLEILVINSADRPAEN